MPRPQGPLRKGKCLNRWRGYLCISVCVCVCACVRACMWVRACVSPLKLPKKEEPQNLPPPRERESTVNNSIFYVFGIRHQSRGSRGSRQIAGTARSNGSHQIASLHDEEATPRQPTNVRTGDRHQCGPKTKKRRHASPPMCGQEIVINVDRKPLILLS